MPIPSPKQPTGGPHRPREGHSWWRLVRRLLCWCGAGLACLLCLVLLAVAGTFVWLRTESAHSLIVEKANPVLAEALAPQGLKATITRLSGKLPFAAELGLTLADRDGVWLTLPEIRFDLDWSFSERTVYLRELVLAKPTLTRQPVLPPSEQKAEPPAAPFDPQALRTQLDEAGQALFALPNWLPNIVVENIAIEKANVAEGLLGFGLTADFGVRASFVPAAPSAQFALTALNIDSDLVRLRTALDWQNLPDATSLVPWLDGAFNGRVDLQITPPKSLPTQGLLAEALAGVPALTTLSGPATTNFVLAGSLLAPRLELNVDALGLAGKIQAALNVPRDDWANLLRAMTATTDMALHIDQWRDVNALVPGQNFSGSVDVKAHAGNTDGPLAASLDVQIPRFAMGPAGGGQGMAVNGVSARIALDDALGRAQSKASLDVAQIAAAGLKLGSTLRLEGPLGGLVAELTGLTADMGATDNDKITLSFGTSGDVTAKLQAQWQPGSISLPVCNVRLPSRLVMPAQNGGTTLGLVAMPGASVRYGQNGLAVNNVDLRLLPAGHIQAGGVLAPDKLDFRLDLRDFALTKWQALVPALPKGTVELAARLAGSPQKPGGNFRVGVRGLDVRSIVPNLPLATFDVAVQGTVAQALDVNVELPRQTLKTLGADSMTCKARVPLVFAANGVPSPDTKGELAAQIDWHGQLAPLWALVPQADRRLKGKLDIALKASGTMDAPALKGTVAVDNAHFEDLAIGALLQDMGLKITLDGRNGASGPEGSAHVNFVAKDGTGGSLALKGKSNLDGTGIDMRATLDNLRPLKRHDVRVAMSGQAQVTGEATAPDVRGEIRINMAALLLDNISTGADSVTTLPISEANPSVQNTKKPGAKSPAEAGKAKAPNTAPVTAKAPAKSKQGSLHLDIVTPGRIIVDGRGLVSEWKTEMQIRGTPQAPLISGGLSSTKGKLDFLNRQFELTRGVVSFAGGSPANPLLDLFLTNNARGFTSHIAITGPAQKFQLELSSEPPLPRDEVLSQILFGRNVNELGRLETLQLAAAVAKLAGVGSGATPLDVARDALGVDVLRVNTGSGAGEGDDQGGVGNATVETGKYLTDEIYVGIEQGAKEGSTAATIELELTPRTKVQLRSDQNNTGGILNWKMNY